MDNSPYLKRDAAFVALAILVVLGIWSPAWDAPTWQPVVLYSLAALCIIPAVMFGRKIGFETLGNALVPVLAIVAMMLGAISHFVWEMFLRY